MLSSSLQSVLENRIRYLPEITGKAIQSVDWATKLVEIGKKFGLHMEDIEDLQGVVMKSMVGLLVPARFEDNVISATALSPRSAEQLIAEVNAQILDPIHQYVMSGGKKADTLTETGIVPVPPDTDDQTADHTPAQETKDTSAANPEEEAVGELVLPEVGASPSRGDAEPSAPDTPRKPLVPGKFDDFFINAPTETDHSMLR